MRIKKVYWKIAPLALIAIPSAFTITGCSLYGPTKFVMHRGLSSRFFENTEAAFVGAGKKHSIWGIETDIYLTSDSKLVCAHDINPFRVSDSNIRRDAGYFDGSGNPVLYKPNPDTGYWAPKTGTQITNLTLSQVQAKKLWTGYVHKDSTDKYDVCREDTNLYGIGGDQFTPSFIKYLEICKKYKKEAIIEIKDENEIVGVDYDNKLINELISEINSVNYAKHCTVIAFDDSEFDRSEPFYKALTNATSNTNSLIANTAKKLLPKFQKLCWEDTNHSNVLADAYESLQKGISVDVDANFVTSDLVKFAHEKKLIVNTWTVNEKSQKDELIELGVDQITGNVVF